MPLFRQLLLLAALCLLGCQPTSGPDQAAPDRDPTPAYGALLKQVVSEDGYVDYAALAANRAPLDAYVAWLGAGGGDENRRHRSPSRFLNAFTAWTLYRVLEEGIPTEGIRWRHRPGLRIFLEPRFPLGDEGLSLSELAHERIRMTELDPLVHGGLTCAAVGCPPMRDAPWGRGPRLRAQLEDQMRRWLGDPRRGLRITEDHVEFSPIFKWFGRDFSFWTAGRDLCAIASDYLTGPQAEALRDFSARGCPHRFFAFDARLNSIDHSPASGRLSPSPPGGAPLVR